MTVTVECRRCHEEVECEVSPCWPPRGTVRRGRNIPTHWEATHDHTCEGFTKRDWIELSETALTQWEEEGGYPEASDLGEPEDREDR